MIKEKLNRQLKILIGILLGIILFSLSFPGIFTQKGIPYLSMVALFPVYLGIYNMRLRETVFYGFIYGTLNYLIFNYWLKSFSPVAFSVVPIIQGIYSIALFYLIKLIMIYIKRFQYLHLTLLWLIYEVFRGENFIGYNYGTIAHAFYRTHHFTGIVDITGTYVLSLLIIFPSIYLAYVIYNKVKFSIRSLAPLYIYLFIFISSILYTQLSRVDYSQSPTTRISLIQHNLNCWAKGSTELYKNALIDLIDLSKKAELNDPDLVIWSESAFVPAIEWHKKFQVNKGRYDLVIEMEEFISSSEAIYLVGSNETIGKPGADKERYNPVYQYQNGQITSKYRKNRLVPFTEYFPYPKLMPWLYNYTLSLGASQLLPGKSTENFNLGSYTGTPLICYEDTFSELSRDGVKKGSSLLINLTNDAWTEEIGATVQHLSAAVFRTIENRRTMVRSGTSGYTCVIDPNGKIIAELPILVKDQLTFDTPLYSEKMTLYTKYGNIIENILIIIFFMSIPGEVLLRRIKETNQAF